MGAPQDKAKCLSLMVLKIRGGLALRESTLKMWPKVCDTSRGICHK